MVVEENGQTTVRNEGGFGHSCPNPYPVSYRAIVARKGECTNLLVPVGLSSSQVAFGSIRREPVSHQAAMILRCCRLGEWVDFNPTALRLPR